MTRRIRTSITPAEVIEVSDAEYADLYRMGLVQAVEPEKPAPQVEPAPAPLRAANVRVPLPRATITSEKENSNG